MTPSGLQEPSEPVGVSQMVCGGPPATSTFRSFPAPLNATWRLSGDQNRRTAPSVPGSGWASSASIGRTHTWVAPCLSVAMNATVRPSGAISGDVGLLSPSGTGIANFTSCGGSGARFVHATANPIAASAATPHAAHATSSRVLRRTATMAGRPTREPPFAIHWSSAMMSRAVCQRSSGSLARQRDTSRSRAGGVSGMSCSSGFGVVASTDAMTLDAVLPSNARCPVSSSYSTQPNAKMSVRASTSRPSICSGAMYCGVPTTVWAPVSAATVACSAEESCGERPLPDAPSFARPKSSSFTPCLVSRMFAGFRSRWTIPFLCAAVSASQISYPVLQGLLERQGPADGLAVDVLHDQVAAAVVLADVVQRADVRVVQGGNGPGFPLETLGKRPLDGLDGHVAVQPDVSGLVDVAHASGTGSLDDFVGTQPVSGRKGHCGDGL